MTSIDLHGIPEPLAARVEKQWADFSTTATQALPDRVIASLPKVF